MSSGQGQNLSYGVFALLFLVKICICTDDYEYLRKVREEQERIARSQPANSRLDGLYSIKSDQNNLYLTARKGFTSLGPVILNRWSDSASQLWGVTKFDTSRGYNLKPLANEFNIVTSTLQNNAHAYNAWEFKKMTDRPNIYTIYNTLSMTCLQTSSLKKVVRFEKCQPNNPLQLWELIRID